MALQRVSPGIYRNQQGGLVRSQGQPQAPMATTMAARRRQPGIRRLDRQNQRAMGQVEGGALDLAGTATDLAQERLTQGEFGTGFQPQLADRAMPEDVVAAQKQAEDEAYAYLTRDFAQQEQLANEQADQSLANRGIPYSADPNSRYQQEKRDIINRFDEARLEAKQSAGAEGRAARESLFTQQEKLRADQLKEQLDPRVQNQAEIEAFSRLGVPEATALENTKLKRKELKQRGRLTRKQIAAQERIAAMNARAAGPQYAPGGSAEDPDGDGIPG